MVIKAIFLVKRFNNFNKNMYVVGHMLGVDYKQKVRAKHVEIFFDGNFFLKVILNDEVELQLNDLIEQRNTYRGLSRNNPPVALAIPQPLRRQAHTRHKTFRRAVSLKPLSLNHFLFV